MPPPSQPVPPPYQPAPPQPNHALGTVQQPGGYAIAPKNPAISLLISFFVPGVGSMINGSTTIGVIILVGFLVSIPLMFVCVGFVTYFGFWVWGMIDAYTSAQKWNQAHGIVS